MTSQNTDELKMQGERHEGSSLQLLIPSVDLQDARRRLVDDIPLIVRLLQQFSDDCTELKQLQSTTIETIDLSTLGQEMHRIRGAAGNLAATRILQHALQIEQWIQARDADSPSSPAPAQELAPLLSELRRALFELRLQLKAVHAALQPELPFIAAQAADCSSLHTALRERNFDAVALFREAENTLKAAMPSGNFADLKSAIEKLDFRTAAALLPIHF